MARAATAWRQGAIVLLAGVMPVFAAKKNPTPAATAPTTYPTIDARMRSPGEERATMVLQDGYRMNLVASEPEVISPVLCAWDGNGRMYVAEMRSYMLDLDGSKAHTPMSRISRWEDTDGDGVYDKRTTFADKLMLPRMVLPLDDRILVRETDTKDIYSYRDTNGDGVADEKVKVYEGGKQEGNLEHQPSGLIWDVDNWIYVTNQNERFRFTRGKMEKEEYKLKTGQWGLAMDDCGKLIYATAGSENPAHHFQVMPVYGDVSLPGEVQEGFRDVYSLVLSTDFEGGPPRVKPGGGLKVFTGCCGGSVFRGDALPADLYGNYILPEPVGRLIRRAKISNVNGKTVISNVYDKKEFVAATDPNFRPVFSATGPDGLMYVCDMYHGIIQEANWTKEGSYLRGEIKKYGFQKNINGGRIWRMTHDKAAPRKLPHMLDETPAQLVKHLSDANGWWRDTAQKLVILRGDKSVVPMLKEMAIGDSNPMTRLHALWTLEGLDAADAPFVIEKLKDEDARVRAAAVRVAEPILRKKDARVLRAVRALAGDPDANVAIQVCLTMFYLDDHPDFVVNRALDSAVRNKDQAAVIKDVVGDLRNGLAKSKADEEARKALAHTDPAVAAVFEKGRNYYGQMCVTCHAPSGMGVRTPEKNSKTLAPALKGSPRLLGDPDITARVVLNGLTGVNEGKSYPGQMASFRWADDDWLAAVLTYARNEWGNGAGAMPKGVLTKVRAETASRNKPYTTDELKPSGIRKSRPVLLTAGMAMPHGNEVIYSTDALRFGMHTSAWASWKAPVADAGDYLVKLRAESFGPSDFTLKVGDRTLPGETPVQGEGEITVGRVSLKGGDVAVELRPVEGQWSPMNVTAVILEKVD